MALATRNGFKGISLAFIIGYAQAQFLLHRIGAEQLQGASKECLQALNGGVECSEEICSLYSHPNRFLEIPALNELCTNKCYSSLLDHRQNIIDHCAADARYHPDPSDDSSYKAVAHLAERAIYNYNFTCMMQRRV